MAQKSAKIILPLLGAVGAVISAIALIKPLSAPIKTPTPVAILAPAPVSAPPEYVPQGEIRTARDAIAWDGDSFHYGYLDTGASGVGDLRVRDEATGVEQVLASNVGSFALELAPSGRGAVLYKSGPSLRVRIRDSAGIWAVAAELASSAGPIPALYPWDTSAGMRIEAVWHAEGGGIWASRYNGMWEAAKRLDDGKAIAEYPAIIGNGLGQTWAAWRETSSSGRVVIRVSGRANDASQWVRWTGSVTGADPSIGLGSNGRLVMGYQDRCAVYVGTLDPLKASVSLADKVKLDGAALFAGMAPDGSALIWSHWAKACTMTDYTTRTVYGAVYRSGEWATVPITTETGYQGQPGIARGNSAWRVVWANHATNKVSSAAIQ